MTDSQHCLETQCPIQFTLDLIGSKWAILILRELFAGSRRTHDFLEALPGISTKTLTQRLRQLEEYGLIHRQVFPEVPPHVEYTLTPKGQQIQPVLRALYQVGINWLELDGCDCSMLRPPSTELPAEHPLIPTSA